MEEQVQNQVVAVSDLRTYLTAMQTDINRIRDFANELSNQVGVVIINIDTLSTETPSNG
jgi:capsule polysaccharide export protein KpsE/RkpR